MNCCLFDRICVSRECSSARVTERQRSGTYQEAQESGRVLSGCSLVAERSELTLVHWRAFDVPLYEGFPWTRHLVGWSREAQQGHVSSPICSFDPQSGEFQTLTGRILRLDGSPGLNDAAIFMWATWKAISGVLDDREVTHEVVAAMDADQVQVCRFCEGRRAGVGCDVQSRIAMRSASAYRMQTFGINRQGRDFAIGDVHGCFGEMKAILGIVQFDERVHRLLCVGDLIGRGGVS